MTANFFGACAAFYLLGRLAPALAASAGTAAALAFGHIPPGGWGIFAHNLLSAALLLLLGRLPSSWGIFWVRLLILLNGGVLGLLQARGLFFMPHMVPETLAILLAAEDAARRSLGRLPWAIALFALGAWMEAPLWTL